MGSPSPVFPGARPNPTLSCDLTTGTASFQPLISQSQSQMQRPEAQRQ